MSNSDYENIWHHSATRLSIIEARYDDSTTLDDAIRAFRDDYLMNASEEELKQFNCMEAFARICK